MIELTRVHLFNIITQYRAIFSDEGNVVPSTIASNVNETDIFYSWLNQKVWMIFFIMLHVFLHY